jgi:hypothetical protein
MYALITSHHGLAVQMSFRCSITHLDIIWVFKVAGMEDGLVKRICAPQEDPASRLGPKILNDGKASQIF